MSAFSDYRPKLERMNHEELYSFYKGYNNYIKSRVVLKRECSWDDKIRVHLDKMDQVKLSEFNKNFKSYIQNRLVHSEA
ncbi:MAG: hypothetical protein INQ03_04580 [Candidatus Heimdallarchaeota archaeon]|nr:hypothetical protein [Candidatus Heimdallarchaeota archaeon]